MGGHRAAVIGAGHTPFGVVPDGPRSLLRRAIDGAFASVDRGIERRQIDAAYLASLGFGGWQIGNSSAILAEEAGLPGLPSVRIENACASGGFALQVAVGAIASGSAHAALVVGLEKMTDVSNARRRYWLGVSGETEWERQAGLTFAGVYGLIASRYLALHGVGPDALAEVAVKNHANGALNPNAHFRKPITREAALASPRVADPLRLYDCCPVSDGAAALLLVAPEAARRYTDTPVFVDGVGAASDYLAVQERPEPTRFDATRRAGEAALRSADCTRAQISFLELHDCFTIAELLALEDLGFAAPGGAGPMTLAGETQRTGRLPVNPDGGLKAKGHPIGATGVSQAAEVFLQLRGAAGARQVAHAERALAHNVGGAGATAAVTIFSAG
ncbi:MAG TPA: beta-ketoacyl synthase N-terminal-like domain-containing protein [Thermoplasmata archaeon]|nr:beta-ketoacyl synthase N-terminal-like domain-containing protein [Thermoplasmata archaeon]